MKRGCFLLISIIFVLFSNVITAGALNTGFNTNQLSTEEKNAFISNVNISQISNEPAKKAIKCFDVNNNGLIAIGQNTSDRKTVCVYSSDGVFQYGYTFNCSGDFGVEWDGDNLNIYFVRSHVIVSATPNGEITDAFEVPDTIENNSYINHFIHSTERTIGDTEYFIGNNLGILNWIAPSYSQIIVKDSTGVKNIIYDVNSMQLTKMIVIISIIFVAVIAVIVTIARQIIKVQSKK